MGVAWRSRRVDIALHSRSSSFTEQDRRSQGNVAIVLAILALSLVGLLLTGLLLLSRTRQQAAESVKSAAETEQERVELLTRYAEEQHGLDLRSRTVEEDSLLEPGEELRSLLDGAKMAADPESAVRAVLESEVVRVSAQVSPDVGREIRRRSALGMAYLESGDTSDAVVQLQRALDLARGAWGDADGRSIELGIVWARARLAAAGAGGGPPLVERPPVREQPVRREVWLREVGARLVSYTRFVPAESTQGKEIRRLLEVVRGILPRADGKPER